MMEVIEVTDLSWSFESGPKQRYGFAGDGYQRFCDVHPDPAYKHDLEELCKEAEKTSAVFPLKHTPVVYVFNYEFTTRTNGFADRNWNYDDRDPEGKCRTWRGDIVLSAKSTPIHPAMSRYMVSHEYGHHVEWEIARVRGLLSSDYDAMRREYQKLRGGSLDYGRGRWHENVGELFANDFRILVAETEVEYWPHPGFKHPFKRPDIQQWWAEAVEEVQNAGLAISG